MPNSQIQGLHWKGPFMFPNPFFPPSPLIWHVELPRMRSRNENTGDNPLRSNTQLLVKNVQLWLEYSSLATWWPNRMSGNHLEHKLRRTQMSVLETWNSSRNWQCQILKDPLSLSKSKSTNRLAAWSLRKGRGILKRKLSFQIASGKSLFHCVGPWTIHAASEKSGRPMTQFLKHLCNLVWLPCG